LGVDESLVGRHPFPGPGIAIRILGDVTKERVEIARKADHIFISMIKEAGLYDQISQAFAGLDTNRSVGVFGDQRVWGYIIILRAVRTKDFMSAEIFKFDLEFLEVSLDVLVTLGTLPKWDPKLPNPIPSTIASHTDYSLPRMSRAEFATR